MEVKLTEPNYGEPASEFFKEAGGIIYDILHQIATIVIESGQPHISLLLIHDPRTLELHRTIELRLGSKENKNAAAILHREIGELGYIAILIHESRMLKIPKEEGTPQELLEKYGKVSIKDNPLRKEVLLFNLAYNKECLVAFCDIERPANKLIKAELKDILEVGVAGRFAREKKLSS